MADESDVRAATRLVWPLLALRTIAAVVYGADVVLLAIIATNQLRQGTGGYGWLLAAAGAGGLLGASWLRRRPQDDRTSWRSAVGLAAYALPLLIFLLSPLLVGSLAVQLVRGTGCVLLTATIVAALQRAVPSSVAGRVFGFGNVLVLVGTSAGAIIAPGLVNLLGLDSTLAVAAVAPCIAGALVLPALRRFDTEGSDAIAALDPRVDTLRRLAIFEDASRSTLYSVADRIVDLDLPPGLELIVEGDPSDALYVLARGRMEVYVNTTAGRVQVRELRSPAYVGEIGIIHGIARTATVVTSTECHVWKIPAGAFLQAAGQAGLSGALTDGVMVRLHASSVVS